LPIDAKLVEQLYRRAHAERWRVPLERFAEALERGADRGADVRALHLEDLALACGCAAGDDAAWEHFIREHRPTLYRAADALDPSGSARDLADGIYGELFERSLFRYFHGRSSLYRRKIRLLRLPSLVELNPDLTIPSDPDISR
jgi:hypothetical protein